MLGRLVAFFRRLLAGRGRPERREWVRHPCPVQVRCLPPAPAAPALAAEVQDISRGGLRLVVGLPVEPGALLRVELPGPVAVLAYVLRVTPLSRGEWALGCAFAAELGDEDLQALGARRARPGGPDRRGWARFPCETAASYRVVGAALSRARPATVLDVSPAGVRLRVRRPPEVGQLFSIQFGGPAGLTLLASVVRVGGRTDDGWVVGASFVRELRPEELGTILSAARGAGPE